MRVVYVQNKMHDKDLPSPPFFPKYSHKKVKYDALWQINLIKGFLIVCPIGECGARMYENENTGKRIPAK